MAAAGRRSTTASAAAVALVGFLHPNGSVRSRRRRYRSEWCVKVSFLVHQETAAVSSAETQDRWLLCSSTRSSSAAIGIKVSFRVDTESTEAMARFGSSPELFFGTGSSSSFWLWPLWLLLLLLWLVCRRTGRKEIALVVHTEIASAVHK